VSKAEIELQGKRYSVACAPGQETRLEALAVRLDKRCGAIADAVGSIGEERLLLIAALALMDELDSARSSGADTPEATRAAGAALSDVAARIDAIATRIEAAL